MEANNNSQVNNHFKTIIIGGGISGLAAADTFNKKGFTDFLVLEADSRIGGRIQSIILEPSGIRVELGANWIHGVEANPIFKLAQENNLLSLSNYSGRGLGQKMIFLTDRGDAVHPRIVNEVDIAFGQLLAKAEDFYHEQISVPCEEDSLGVFIEREFEYMETSKKSHNNDLPTKRMVLKQRLLGETIINGANSMKDVSLNAFGCFEDIPGVHFVIPSGFESIINLLANDLPKGCIQTNKQVIKLNWDETLQDGLPIRVECLDGSEYYAENCLITIPLGYLKKHHERLFTPSLPQFKIDSISEIGMGTVDKLILVFDGPVFPGDIFRLELIWHLSENEKLILDTIKNNHQEHNYQTAPKTHSKNDLSQHWFKKIPFLEAIAPNILVGWLSGEEAEYIESISDKEIAEQMTSVLKKFLHKTIAELPKLEKVYKTSWKSNPFTLGSYCHIPSGTSADAIYQLALPVYNSHEKTVLFFAGEATDQHFYSSSHGALRSGKREAVKIMTKYNYI